ncbi:MAG: diguanylate cyclase [Bdellovibrionota bacterium]
MSKPGEPKSTPSHFAKYADLFDRLLDSVFLIDPETQCVLEANPNAERMLGMPHEKVIGQPITDWVEEGQRHHFSKALRIALRRYYPRQFDSTWNIEGDRQLIFEILACSLKLQDGSSVLQVIARDVTFRRTAEQKVRELLHELQTANVRLEALSTTDAMTGLYNYRHFKNKMDEEHTRSARYKKTYSVVFCDLDHFKHYNDANGHPAGDQLLRDFADIMRASCRGQDFAARYGGEEFIVICPETPAEGALILAERIRSTVEKTVFPLAKTQPLGKVTVSIGVASFPSDADNAERLLEIADQALYRSKSSGRNRVTLASQLQSRKADAA